MSKVIITNFQPEYDVIPHAIFWRTLRYFTLVTWKGEDDLDNFEAASFIIGNEIRFDLRSYEGHPPFTVTLYLSNDIIERIEIEEAIKKIIQDMYIPHQAVAWRRGEPFEYGTLSKKPTDRFLESEARVLALKIAAQEPNRTASTQVIKREIPKYIQLSNLDRKKSSSRPNEQIWHQIVGNVISHQKSSEGPFAKGYAFRTKDGLTVTDKGMDYLNSIGFLGEVSCFAE